VRWPSARFPLLGEKYDNLIQEALSNLNLELDNVLFVTAEEDPSIPPQRKDGGFGPVPAPRPPPAAAHAQSHPRQARLTGPRRRSSNPATPSTASSSGNGISLPAPHRLAVAERALPRPTIRSFL